MSSPMAVESDGKSLKDALCAQQRLLQQLYHELDVEREAAATAASEAMSMILRLQGEKAAVKMEAEQYKRLAEEKMNHAEESMETLDEIMYHKEMEIASLDYQVQAYRYKLLSLGSEDLGVHEFKYPENLLHRNESFLVGESSCKNSPKRLPLPNLKKGLLERDRSIADDPDMIAKVVEESLRDDENHQNHQTMGSGLRREFSSTMDISSYLEQIRELDKVVEQVAGEQSLCSTAIPLRSPSIPSKMNELNLTQSCQKLIDDKISPETCRTPSVCDVFEVPLVEETLSKDVGKSVSNDEGKSVFKDEGKSMLKDDEKVKKLTPIAQSPLKLHHKFETDLPSSLLFIDEGKSTFRDDEKVRNVTPIERSPVKLHHRFETDSAKKSLFLRHKKRKLLSFGSGTSICSHLAGVQRNTTTEITNGETETLEQNVGQERVTSREERELRLLNEINEKLNSIQSEIRSRNTEVKESSSNCDLPMLMLREALWDLWI